MENRWLEDHVGIVGNLYIMLIQSEMDKFHQVIGFINDYYEDAGGEIIAEKDEAADPIRLPMMEIPKTKVTHSLSSVVSVEFLFFSSLHTERS